MAELAVFLVYSGRPIRIWQMTTPGEWKPTQILTSGGYNDPPVETISWSRDGQHLIAEDDSALRVWSIFRTGGWQTNRSLQLLADQGRVRWSQWRLSANGTAAIRSRHSSQGEVQHWSMGGSAGVHSVKRNEKIFGHGVSCSGLRLLTATRASFQMWQFNSTIGAAGQWQPEGRALKIVCNYGNGFLPIQWSADDSHVAIGCTTRLFVWKPTARKKEFEKLQVQGLHRGKAVIACLAWSPDSSRIAFGLDGAVGVWQRKSNEKLRELRGHDDFVCSLAWSPDGQLLASASRDSIRVWSWNMTDGSFQQQAWFQVTHCSNSSGYRISRCDSSPKISWAGDSSYLVTSACDTALRFHDARAGFRVEFRLPMEGEVQDVEWSPDLSKLHVILKGSRSYKFKSFSLPPSGSILAALGFHFPTAAPGDWTTQLCSSPQVRCSKTPGRYDLHLSLSAAQLEWNSLVCGVSSRRVGADWVYIKSLEIHNWSAALEVLELPQSCTRLCELLSEFMHLETLLLQGPLVRGFWMCGLLTPTLKHPS